VRKFNIKLQETNPICRGLIYYTNYLKASVLEKMRDIAGVAGYLSGLNLGVSEVKRVYL